MPKQLKAKVVKGTIVPDLDTLTSMLKSVTKDLKSDKASARSFIKSPKTYMLNRGVNSDLVRELLREEGFKLGAGAAGDCTVTCICSEGCCVTCWGVGSSSSMPDVLVSVYPEFKNAIKAIAKI